jgi:hypothetical protein
VIAARRRRVLLSCSPGLGHFYPLLPLGRELRERGHTVAVLTSATLGEAVSAEGFELLPAGPGLEVLVASAVNRRPDLASIATTMPAAIPIFADVRVELTLPDAMVAATWRPDLVVSEHADFVGPLLAAMVGAERVTVGFGPGHPADWLELASRAVAPHYAAEGLPPPQRGGLYEGLYLDTCPASLQAPRFPHPARSRLLRVHTSGRVQHWDKYEVRACDGKGRWSASGQAHGSSTGRMSSLAPMRSSSRSVIAGLAL